MAIKYRENGQSVTRANIGGGGGSTQITVETPTVTNATPYKYTGSALGPTITWDSSAMANYVNITNATGTAVGQYVLTLALKNPTLSMWDDLTTADKTYNYDIIPDGATATANDVQTLLKCADIFDKAYTTISQVLADSSLLAQIISSENAIDYLVRSTTWATDVCSDSGAMGLIGLNNYASNTLLADSTWLNAIANSTYIESVLNVKVPTMTSNTTPSGVVIFSQEVSPYAPWKAFNESQQYGVMVGGDPKWIGYDFSSSVKIDVIMYKNINAFQGKTITTQVILQGSNDKANWSDIRTILASEIALNSNNQYFAAPNNTKYRYYRLIGDWNTSGYGTRLQFYGREDV